MDHFTLRHFYLLLLPIFLLQRTIRSLLNRIDHCPEILQRRIQLQVMRGADEQTAATPDCSQTLENLILHIVRRAKRKRLLDIHRTPKTQPVAEIIF